MSSDVYNTLTEILLYGSLAALGFAAVYFVAALVGWRGPYRKHRLVRFGLFLAAFPVLAAIQQTLLWCVFLPSLARENQRMVKERSKERIEASSVAQVGDRAPSFTLMNTEGNEFVLDDYRGKVVLINFFATWCGPCLKELPHVQEISDAHRENSQFALIVIGREETTDAINEFRLKHGYTFQMAPDPQRSVYSLFAKELIPRTYLVGTDGQICFASTGFDENDLMSLKAEVVKQLRAAR